MKPTSDLQQKFPLSPRKFWKKMYSVIISAFFFSFLMGVSFAIMFPVALGADLEPLRIIVITFAIGIPMMTLWVALYAMYVRAYIRTYFYAGEGAYLTIKKGVFAPSEIHVQYQKIQDVYVDQDVIDRIMGLYDVHIASATAASGIEAHIDGVDKDAADGLKKFLLDTFSSKGNHSDASVAEPVRPASSERHVALSLSEEISSAKYPLTGKWLGIELFGRIIGSLFTAAALSFIIIVKTTDLSVDKDFGTILLMYLGFLALTIIWKTVSLFLWRSNYSFDFTPEHIYYKDGIISVSEKHMPYSSMQDVILKQGILDRIFGLADVRIENAAAPVMVQTRRGSVAVSSGILIQGLSLADAKKITGILKESVLGKNSARYGL